MISLKSEAKVDKCGHVYFRVSYMDGDALIQKDLSLADYRRVINESVEEETSWVDVPRIPCMVYKAQVSSKGEMDGYRVLLYVKEQKFPFSYAGNIMRLPFPSLMFYLEVKGGVIRERKVFAVKDEFICPNSELYFYPFGNVYEDGRICMGNINVSLPTMQDSEKFVDAFIEGRTNSDLARMKNSMGYTQTELIEKVREKEVYPKEYLYPFGKKVKDIM